MADADLHDLLRDPKETLATELKQWLDPASPHGIAKIAKACIALRNNNGGTLLIGFTNEGKQLADGRPTDIRATYHPDIIQGIVSKYSHPVFEATVEFISGRDGLEHPIVIVPSGVTTPVAARSDLHNPDNSKEHLVRSDVVYIRTLESNNTVSTSTPTYRDWDRIVRNCFENREADVGAFIRRHLVGVDIEATGRALASAIKPPRSASDNAIAFLDAGKARYDSMMASRKLQAPTWGTREAAIVIDGAFPTQIVDGALYWKLQAAKPQHSGWSPWMDSGNSTSPDERPYVFDNGWEALLVNLNAHSLFRPSADFWRIASDGKFYHLRALEDDMSQATDQRKPPPNTQLDFMLQISRVAEIISVGMSFARTLGCDETTTNLAFAFRWSGLARRHLSSWAEPSRNFYSRSAAVQDSQTTSVVVPLETALSSLTPYVEALVNPLFALFGGQRFETSVVNGIVRRTLEQRF